MSVSTRPFLSVIVPVFNGAAYLPRVLDAILSSSINGVELIVVDDCSTDDSAQIAASREAVLVKTNRRSGPAEARNLGVQHAHADLLCFVDADCLINSDTLDRVSSFLMKNSDLDAVFGTYDDTPATANWFGRYKNLYLHHIYQNAAEQTRIFSTACGCVRREAYLAVKGFREPYRYMPGMQDVEFGYRLNEAGFKTRILKDVQVCHLKDWGIRVFQADLLNRGIPWMKIILSNPGRLEDERNMSGNQKFCLVLAWMIVLATAALPQLSGHNLVAALMVLLAGHCLIAIQNLDLLTLMYRRYGAVFVVFSYLMHFIYYLNCGVSMVLGTIFYFLDKIYDAAKNLNRPSIE